MQDPSAQWPLWMEDDAKVLGPWPSFAGLIFSKSFWYWFVCSKLFSIATNCPIPLILASQKHLKATQWLPSWTHIRLSKRFFPHALSKDSTPKADLFCRIGCLSKHCLKKTFFHIRQLLNILFKQTKEKGES